MDLDDYVKGNDMTRRVMILLVSFMLVYSVLMQSESHIFVTEILLPAFNREIFTLCHRRRLF